MKDTSDAMASKTTKPETVCVARTRETSSYIWQNRVTLKT